MTVKKTRDTRDEKLNKAQRLVKKLTKMGVREIEIASNLGVHFQTVTRWREGERAPHNGHLSKLEEMVKARAAASFPVI